MVMASYLGNNGDVTNFLLPLCRICVKFDTCAKFDDHQRNNNKVRYDRGVGLMTDGSKNLMSNGARFCYNF